MTLYEAVRRTAALLGVHASRLDKHPSTTMLGVRSRPIDLVIDVGANTGQFAREMRGFFPAAHIVSVEPLPDVYIELAAWARVDGNATALNMALGSIEGVLPINNHLDHSTSSSLLPTSEEGIAAYPQMINQRLVEVKIRRLDDVVEELVCAIGANTMLKLDVQGFEEQVLRGASATLGKVGALLTEVVLDPLYSGQAEFLALCQLADAAGLHYAGNYSQILADDGHVIFLDALFVRRPPQS